MKGMIKHAYGHMASLSDMQQCMVLLPTLLPLWMDVVSMAQSHSASWISFSGGLLEDWVGLPLNSSVEGYKIARVAAISGLHCIVIGAGMDRSSNGISVQVFGCTSM
jgi:hypothetical protein